MEGDEDDLPASNMDAFWGRWNYSPQQHNMDPQNCKEKGNRKTDLRLFLRSKCPFWGKFQFIETFGVAVLNSFWFYAKLNTIAFYLVVQQEILDLFAWFVGITCESVWNYSVVLCNAFVSGKPLVSMFKLTKILARGALRAGW